VKLGRLPRTFDPRIPHLSAILAGHPKPPAPAAIDYTKNGTARLPSELGMFLNNKLQNCSCAAYYHARQVWTFHANGKPITESDSDVKLLYEQACGYQPSQPGEGPAASVQHVLRFLHKQGAPLGAQGRKRERTLAYLEVDPRNTDDVKRTIADCGVAYIGLNVPENVLPADGDPPKIWTVDPKKSKIIEGHAVVLPGYDEAGAILISWGRFYRMTWEFFHQYVDEVYAIADHAWIGAKKRTPAGLTLPQLEALMKYV
jgi:hypothetical protein